MTTIFGSYDIRGRYPSEINEKVVAEISRRLVSYFKPRSKIQDSRFKIVITHDARLSSLSLYKAVITGFKIQDSCPTGRQAKFKIIEVGLATTPMFYFLVRKLKADLGLIVTASHNPKNYNGLKIVDKNALSITGQEIKKLLKL